MILRKISVYRYQIPLIKPLEILNRKLTSRSGFIVEIKTDSGLTGFGEIAPFPGLHREKNSEVAEIIPKMLLDLNGIDFQIDIDFRNFLEQFLEKTRQFYPSIIFGIEQALADIYSQVHQKNLAEILNTDYLKELPVNALLTVNRENWQQQIDHMRANGFSTVKIKIGKYSAARECEFIRELNQYCNGKLKLRLDANRSLSESDLIEYDRFLKDIPLEYLEEPLQDVARLKFLHKQIKLPLALDESIPELQNDISDFPFISAIVLKPDLIGSLSSLRKMIEFARHNQFKIVFSSAFLSGLGLRYLIQLAAAFGSPNIAMGFDTWHWLAGDILHQPLPEFSTIISTEKYIKHPSLPNFSKLQKVAG